MTSGPRARLAVAGAVVLALAVVAIAAPPAMTVTSVTRDRRVLVTVDLPGLDARALGAGAADGVPVTYRYGVELRRSTAFWFSRRVARADVSVTARFDVLDRLFHVSQVTDGRAGGERVTTRGDDAARWLGHLDLVPLADTASLQAGGEYDLRATASTRDASAWFAWPWGAVATARTRLTVLP